MEILIGCVEQADDLFCVAGVRCEEARCDGDERICLGFSTFRHYLPVPSGNPAGAVEQRPGGLIIADFTDYADFLVIGGVVV